MPAFLCEDMDTILTWPRTPFFIFWKITCISLSFPHLTIASGRKQTMKFRFFMLINPFSHSLRQQLWSLRTREFLSVFHSSFKKMLVKFAALQCNVVHWNHMTVAFSWPFPYILGVTVPCVSCIIETMMSFVRLSSATLYSFGQSTWWQAGIADLSGIEVA